MLLRYKTCTDAASVVAMQELMMAEMEHDKALTSELPCMMLLCALKLMLFFFQSKPRRTRMAIL